MSHKAVRTLISDVLKSIDDSIFFHYGRQSDFNSKEKREAKRVNLDLIEATQEYTGGQYNLTTKYKIGLVFYKLQDPKTGSDVSADILDEMDDLVDRFVQKLNVFSFTESVTVDGVEPEDYATQSIELTGIQRSPAVKVLADCCTGWVLEFEIIAPDKFDYCTIYE